MQAKAMASFFLAGLSIGWLGGLSESPVASSVLTAIVAAIVGAASTLLRPAAGGQPAAAGLSTTSAPAVAALVFGMAFGVPFGITVRAHGWLGPAPALQLSPDGGTTAATGSKQGGRTGGVGWFDKITDSCAELRASGDKRAALSHQGEAGDRVIAACDGGAECLNAVIDLLCSGDMAGSPSR